MRIIIPKGIDGIKFLASCMVSKFWDIHFVQPFGDYYHVF